jgi:hypothetical protein
MTVGCFFPFQVLMEANAQWSHEDNGRWVIGERPSTVTWAGNLDQENGHAHDVKCERKPDLSGTRSRERD